MNKRLADSLAPQRFYLLLIATFTAIALALSAAGAFGVMSYWVTQRNREMGIRLALGAPSSHILRLLLGESLVLVFFGIVIGLAGAWAATRCLNAMLYGVTALDPLTFTLMPLALAAVALIASWSPALRAARVDPVIALRDE